MMRHWKPKTYKQWRTDKPHWFKENGFDIGIQTLCDDWFMYRRLCDTDDKFEYFFKRDLNINYDRYLEQVNTQNLYLRGKIDWFVSNYNEAWNYVKNTTNSTQSNTSETNVENSKSLNVTNSTDRNGTDNTIYGEYGDDTNRTNNTGTQSNKQTNDTTQATTNTGTVGNKQTNNTIQNTANTGTQTTVGSSSGETSSSSTSDGNGTTNSSSTTNDQTNSQHLETTLPMGVNGSSNGSFADFFTANVYPEGGWKTASGKSEDVNTSESTTTGETSNTTHSTTEGSGSSSGTSNSTRTDDLNTETTNTGTIDTLRTDNTNSQTKNTGTVDNVRTDDLLSESEGDYRKNGTNDKTYKETVSGKNDSIETGTSTTTGSGSVKNEGNVETTNLSINTGRTGLEPAKVIDEAIKVIRSMNAWEWFRNILDNDFWLLFEEDEEEEEYGY